MKQLYIAPEIDIEVLSCHDVLQASDNENWGQLYPMNLTFE